MPLFLVNPDLWTHRFNQCYIIFSDM